MKSTITSKFQTTIPKPIREYLGLNMKDSLEWKLENGKVTIYPAEKKFLRHKNTLHVGPGDIDQDIHKALDNRLEKYR